jgi:hypothetical protein
VEIRLSEILTGGFLDAERLAILICRLCPADASDPRTIRSYPFCGDAPPPDYGLPAREKGNLIPTANFIKVCTPRSHMTRIEI